MIAVLHPDAYTAIDARKCCIGAKTGEESFPMACQEHLVDPIEMIEDI